MPYNPCGAVVDFGRSCYRTKARLFRDSDEEVEIQWYFARDDAPTIPYETAVTSSYWDREEVYVGLPYREGVGEVSPGPRIHTRPIVIPAATGRHLCGTREDFERGAVFDPDITPRVYRPDGLPTCCVPGMGLLLGGGPARTGGGLLLGGAAREGRGLYLTAQRRPRAGGLYLAWGGWPLYCDTYSVSPTVGGTSPLFRIAPDSQLWWNDTPGGMILVAGDPEAPDPSWFFSGNGATVFYSSGGLWNGEGCRTFTRTSGTGPDTVDICCAD